MSVAKPTNPVSVVITVLNDAPGVVALIEALLGQTRLPDEIIVVDGGSTDGTFEALEALDAGEVRLCSVRRPGVNIAQGRNHGVTLAGSDIVVCTDAGCVPDHNWLEELTGPFEDPDISVVGGSYRVEARGLLERVVGLLTMPGQLTPLEPPRFNPSARSVAFRVSAWRGAGGFPDWLYTAEDTLFDCKLRRNGALFAYATDAIVRWRPRTTLRAVWKQFRDYARGEARIGRGDGDVSYWVRRYAVAGFAVVAALACGAWMHSVAALAVGASAVVLELIAPVHRRARAVARHTFRVLDYPTALLLSHWVALATINGSFLGRRDRRRHPELFVERLRAYWGSEAVTDVPSWPMKDVPTPRTLIVSWHWPPTNRASTAVLANLFQKAPPEAFRVLTRRMSDQGGGDPLASPPLPTQRVRWPRGDDEDVRCWTWLASVWTAARMVLGARRIERQWPIQRVLAVYPQRYGLLAGWLAARYAGVPLVAYMHDLFAETSITSSRLKRSFWSRIDRAVLTSASLVLVPTREFAAHYARRGVKKCWVLPHCVPAEVTHGDTLPVRGCLNLTYAGSVYQAHEDAIAALAETVEHLPDVDLAFLTNRNRVLLDDRVRWLPRARALARMRASHVLVVALGRQTPYPQEVQGCFPSKIADYLAVGRPILAIVPPGCFVERLLRETGCGVAVTSTSPPDIARAVDLLRDEGLRREMSAKARRLSRQLTSARWLPLLAERLACGAPRDPMTPGFPAPDDAESLREARSPVTVAGAEGP